MAVTATDLLAPTGDLLPEFFPGEVLATITSRLEAYLAQGQAAAAGVTDADARDAAALQWAYSRAYGAIYVRLLHAPASVQVDGEVQTSRLGAQIESFRTLRDAALARFEELVASATRPAAVAPQIPTSDTTPLGFAW